MRAQTMHQIPGQKAERERLISQRTALARASGYLAAQLNIPMKPCPFQTPTLVRPWDEGYKACQTERANN